MGNEPNARQSDSELKDIYRINHPVLSESEIILTKNAMKINLPSQEEQAIREWARKLQKIKQVNKEYLLLPKTYEVRESMMCGSAVCLTAYYDCFPYVLIDEAEHRRKTQGSMAEDEIWYIIWALVDASKSLMDKGFRIGDIRPHNILFNETGELKIINPLSWPGEISNYCKTMYEQKRTYLSLEQLEALNVGQDSDENGGEKSESFSIGLTILSAIYMKDLTFLYEVEPHYYGLNTEKLAEMLENLPKLTYWHNYFNKRFPYSYGLIRVVQRLCEKEPEKRLAISQVWTWLKPHKKKIVGFEPFEMIRGLSEKMSPKKEPRTEINLSPVHQSPIQSLQRSEQNTHRQTQIKTNSPMPPQMVVREFNRSPMVPVNFSYDQNRISSQPLPGPHSVPPRIVIVPSRPPQNTASHFIEKAKEIKTDEIIETSPNKWVPEVDLEGDDLLKRVDNQLSRSKSLFPLKGT